MTSTKTVDALVVGSSISVPAVAASGIAAANTLVPVQQHLELLQNP